MSHSRTRTVNQLHALLRELMAGGALTSLTPAKATRALRGFRPRTGTDRVRVELAKELIADVRRFDEQLKANAAKITALLDGHGARLSEIDGIGPVLAARLLGRTGPPSRFVSACVGTGTHLASESLNLAAGISTRHVPPSPGDDIAATVAKTVDGATDYQMSPIAIAAPYLNDGRLVALGVTAAQRSPLLPHVPAIAEAGVAGYDFPIWYGLWAPAGTPPAIADKVAAGVAAAFADPELCDWLATHGAEPMSMTPTQFARFALEESERAARIIEGSGTELTNLRRPRHPRP